MTNFERIATLPLETLRSAGQALLWITERLVPPKPSVESIGASITILGSSQDEATPMAQGHEADNLNEGSAR